MSVSVLVYVTEPKCVRNVWGRLCRCDVCGTRQRYCVGVLGIKTGICISCIDVVLEKWVFCIYGV